MALLFLRTYEVLAIQARAIEEFGGLHGVRDVGALEAALTAAEENRAYYEQASLPTCAATYAYHLTQARAFLDGNKRLATAVAEIFLELNGAELRTTDLAALREWWRVLKAGGQVGFSGWGPTYQQPLLGLWHARLHQYGVPLPTAAPIQHLSASTTCQQLLDEAGFVEIVVQSEQLGHYLQTPEEWWAQMWASRNRMAVLELTPEQRAQFQAEYLAEVGALATPEGIWIDVATNFARGRKPVA